MNREIMKEEAIKRMKYLNILPQVIEEFEKEDKLELSERTGKEFPAVLYWTSNYKGLDEKIKAFEERIDALVYHVILNHTEFGDMYAMLYVSKNEAEWEEDWEMLTEEGEYKSAFANVWNGDIEEMGSIGIKPVMGGVMRTW